MAAFGTDRGQECIDRMLTKVNEAFKSKKYYEAHQMYRALYHRYKKRGEFKKAIEVLYCGTMQLGYKGQDCCASNLGLLLIDAMELHEGTWSEEDISMWAARLGEVVAGLNSSNVDRDLFINRAVKWTVKVSSGNPHSGHPKLHRAVADILWGEEDYKGARHHYFHTRDGEVFGRILVRIHMMSGLDCEVDLFIVQAILNLLLLKDIRAAEETFTAYCLNHPQIMTTKPPFKQPLLNFIYYVFRCIEDNCGERFLALSELYKPSINRDASFEDFLPKIRTLFFDPPPVPSEDLD